MPCYRCGIRQTDPSRGESPWRRGVLSDELVLICPVCQTATDWTADLDRCGQCASTHLIKRLGQVECLDCGKIRDPAVATSASAAGSPDPAALPGAAGPDPALADEVSRALDRVLGRH